MTFHASNGHKVELNGSGLWYDVVDPDNPLNYWTMDTEDMDLAYADRAILAWTAWREFLVSEGVGDGD